MEKKIALVMAITGMLLFAGCSGRNSHDVPDDISHMQVEGKIEQNIESEPLKPEKPANGTDTGDAEPVNESEPSKPEEPANGTKAEDTEPVNESGILKSEEPANGTNAENDKQQTGLKLTSMPRERAFNELTITGLAGEKLILDWR